MTNGLFQTRCARIALAVLATITQGCDSASPDSANSDPRVLAVLPFEIRGEDPVAAEIGRMFADSLAFRLAPARDLELLDVSAETETPTEGATVVLSGTLIRRDRAVTATARLVDAETGAVSSEVEIRSESGDLARLATDVANAALDSLGVAYPDVYEYLGDLHGGPQTPTAAIGEAMEPLRRGDVVESLRASDELVGQFTDDPVAHVLNAWALLLAWDAAPSNERLVQLKNRLDSLDRVDPANPYGDLLRGYVYRSSGEPDKARMLYSRVLARENLSNATRAWALRQHAFANLQIGNAVAARDDAQQAVDLDPVEAASWIALSKALEGMGDPERAIGPSQQALNLEPFGWRHHQRLGVVLIRADRFDDAVTSLDRACKLSGTQEACANLAVALQRAGRASQAVLAAQHADAMAGTRWGRYNLACVSSLAGDSADALVQLRQAIDLGFADALINSDADLDLLRDDPEFGAIVAEVENRIRTRRRVSTTVFPWQ